MTGSGARPGGGARRPRRARSEPTQVGSDDGLTMSRATPPQDERPASEPAEGSTRHTSAAQQTRDDTDEGWGEQVDDEAAARWLRENRPPHWS